jgi:hypothetical protein
MNTQNVKFNIQLWEKMLKEEGTAKDLCIKYDLPITSMYHAKSGRGISERLARILSEATDIPYEVWTQDKPSIEVVMEYLNESEEVIVGLVGNIKKRLSTTFSQPTINEINETINAIIIESSYLGVMAQKQGNTGFIEMAMKRRLQR